MILDAHDFQSGMSLHTDLCIVGAGAAGISLALRLADSGMEIILLEAGGMRAEPRTQHLYAGEVVDPRLHSPPDRFRQRRFGGTTSIWGGRCTPLDPLDLERREYVLHSGWPISYDDLQPYYPDANRLCEAGAFAYRADGGEQWLPPIIRGFASNRVLTDSLERFSCPTDFGVTYRSALKRAARIRVVLHANCVAVQSSSDGQSIARIDVRTLHGVRFEVRARNFVLATGALEAARLLLASRAVQPHGVGNDRQVVGRFYMCHLAGTLGEIRFARPLADINHEYARTPDGIYCRRRFTLSPAVRNDLAIGNFVGRLHFPRPDDPAHRTGILSLIYLARALISYEYSRRLQGGPSSFDRQLQHVGNVLCDPLRTGSFLLNWLRLRLLAHRRLPSVVIRPRTPRFWLEFNAEQYPNPASRITLTDDCDELGVPRIRVDWRYLLEDVRSVERALQVLREELRLANATFDYDAAEVEAELTRHGAFGGHHIGTTRMGTDLSSSVVDGHCRVHGIDNLYIAGSAVFPTSGQANPTLTLIALALRLGDHLRSRYVPAAGAPL